MNKSPKRGSTQGQLSVWSPAGSPAQSVPKRGKPACDLTPVPKMASAHRQPRSIGQHVLLWHLHTVHDNHACGRGAQGELALDPGGREAPHPLLQQEAPNAVIFTPCPHYKQVSHRRVGDPGGGTGSEGLAAAPQLLPTHLSHPGPLPGLGPIEGVGPAGWVMAGSGLHAARVTPVIRLCEPKAAQELPFGCRHKTLLKGSLSTFMPSIEKCQPLHQARLRQIWPCPHGTFR